MPKLDGCDLRISRPRHAERDREAGRRLSQFDVVVTSDGGDEPPNRPGKIKAPTPN